MQYQFTSPQKQKLTFGNSINDYKVHEVLGKGGFGTVYRATSVISASKGKIVAIKILNKAEMKSQNLTKRVANEVEIHWQLRHFAILELYNYFEDDENVYLVMDGLLSAAD